MRLRPCIGRRGRNASTSVRFDPVTAELVRLGTLLEVVVQAVALQDEADAVILGCARPGEVPCEVARVGRAVAGQYGRLCGWVADLVVTAGSGPLPRRTGELLRYHLAMIDTALKLAFPKCRSERLERHRLALTGLGAPARELRDVEFALRERIVELESSR